MAVLLVDPKPTLASLPDKVPAWSSALAVCIGRLRAFVATYGKAFALDLRSLALFRIGLALLLVWDVGVALTNAADFYSDSGILTREVLRSRLWECGAQWSIHALSGSASFQVGLLCLQLAAAVGLMIGWRTRWATLLCWLLAASLESRNPLITNGADSVMRLLLFWSIFLPLGARWSRDAVRTSVARSTSSLWASLPAACFILQIAFIYVFAASMKDREVWFTQATALQTALHLDVFALPLAVWLRDQTELCAFLTRGSVWLELLGPLLLLVPWRRSFWRLVACGLFIIFHAGIALCMDIGLFPWLMIIAWIALLPGSIWPNATEASVQGDLPVPASHGTPWPVRIFCLFCLGFVFLWNLRGTDFLYWEKWFPRSVNPVGFVLRLDQHWSMFAPFPTREDGWFVLRAGLSDGTEVDLLRGGQSTDWSKPNCLHSSFKDSRWQKVLMNLWMQRYQEYRPAFCERVVREWNARQGGLSQVVAWQFYFLMEPTEVPAAPGRIQRHLLAEGGR
ncbi:MAG: HTTM domain-containing protein [Verrucomicrobium sp.]